MPNERKRSTEIFRCFLNSLRKFSIVFCHFWVPYIFFRFFPWDGRLRKTWRIIEKNKKGNFFPVHLDLNVFQKEDLTFYFLKNEEMLEGISLKEHITVKITLIRKILLISATGSRLTEIKKVNNKIWSITILQGTNRDMCVLETHSSCLVWG